MINPLGLSLVILSLLISIISAESTQIQTYTLFHRIINPSSSAKAGWTSRAIMEFDSSSPNPIPSYQSTSEDALISLLDQSKDVNDAHSMYQLMLVEGSQKLGGRFSEDVKLEKGLLTSLKKCHLTSSYTLSELITFHVSPATSSKPYSLSYSIRDLTLSPNGCPISTISAQKSSPLVKTEIKIRSPSAAPSPPLRTPIAVKEDGTAKEPVPEKSFIQKYWYYAIPLLLLMAMPAEEPETAEGDKTSDQAPPENKARRLN